MSRISGREPGTVGFHRYPNLRGQPCLIRVPPLLSVFADSGALTPGATPTDVFGLGRVFLCARIIVRWRSL